MMKTVIDRLTAKTPDFFKKLRGIGLSLTAIGTSLMAVPENVHLPDQVKAIAGYLLTAGFIMAAVSQFAKVDQPKG